MFVPKPDCALSGVGSTVKKSFFGCFIFYILFIVLFSGGVLAVDVEFELRDLHTNEELLNHVVELEIGDYSFSHYLGENVSAVKLKIDEGVYNISVDADDVSTKGIDYTYSGRISIKDSGKYKILLIPSGTINCLVINSQGNVVPDSSVKITCKSKESEFTADSFGSFRANLPAEGCRLLAGDGVMVGYTDVLLHKGELNNVTIITDNKVQSEESFLGVRMLVILFIVFVCVILVVLYLFVGKKDVLHDQNAGTEDATTGLDTEYLLMAMDDVHRHLTIIYLNHMLRN